MSVPVLKRLGVPGVDRDQLIANIDLKRIRQFAIAVCRFFQIRSVSSAETCNEEKSRARGRRPPDRQIDLVIYHNGVAGRHVASTRPEAARASVRLESITQRNRSALRRLLQRFLDAAFFERGGRRIESGRIDQSQRMRPDDNSLFEIIASRAWLGADQRPITADQAIEQTALAGVGLAEITVLIPSRSNSP